MSLPEPSAEIKAIIEAGIAARGWIVNSYAQFENMLSDLVRMARQLPEYNDLHVPYRTASRISIVREVLTRKGPLAKFGESIGPLIDKFESFEDTRLMLVHAFVRVLHTPKGEVGFQFEHFKTAAGGEATLQSKLYRPAELDAERDRFVTFAQEALQRFFELHKEMGWVGKKA